MRHCKNENHEAIGQSLSQLVLGLARRFNLGNCARVHAAQRGGDFALQYPLHLGRFLAARAKTLHDGGGKFAKVFAEHLENSLHDFYGVRLRDGRATFPVVQQLQPFGLPRCKQVARVIGAWDQNFTTLLSQFFRLNLPSAGKVLPRMDLDLARSRVLAEPTLRFRFQFLWRLR